MARVLKPGGKLAVAVWDSLEHTPGYAAMTELLRRLFGDEAARALASPYSLGDKVYLRSLFEEAGLTDIKLETQTSTARFASLKAWVYTDVRGWTLADVIDDQQYRRLLAEAKKELVPFVSAPARWSLRRPRTL